MRGLFFTGTDTGVGKTYVVAAVANVLRSQGRQVRVSKPVATGAEWIALQWVNEDTRRLAEAAGDDNLARVTPWALPTPAAPPVAARRQGIEFVLEEVAEAVRRCYASGSILLVEGIGGLLCPLTAKESIADLALAIGLPLVIVARRSLGTLNHTLLTLEAARNRGLAVAGVVVSETTPPQSVAEEENVAELRRLGVPVLAVMPHGAESSALACIDWWRLSTHGAPGVAGQ